MVDRNVSGLHNPNMGGPHHPAMGGLLRAAFDRELSKGWFLPPEGHLEAFLAPSGHHEDDLPIEKCKGILGRLEPKMNRA